jgi:hypothetical protein
MHLTQWDMKWFAIRFGGAVMGQRVMTLQMPYSGVFLNGLSYIPQQQLFRWSN